MSNPGYVLREEVAIRPVNIHPRECGDGGGMASHASKWGCDVPSCNCMLEVFSQGKAIDMIKLHIESTHGIQLPPWCESMEDETQVMMKEGG